MHADLGVGSAGRAAVVGGFWSLQESAEVRSLQILALIQHASEPQRTGGGGSTSLARHLAAPIDIRTNASNDAKVFAIFWKIKKIQEWSSNIRKKC